MKLNINNHPDFSLSYQLTSAEYLVVGRERWLVHKDHLPKMYGVSRFLSKQEALDFRETLVEDDAVTPNEIRIYYGQ